MTPAHSVASRELSDSPPLTAGESSPDPELGTPPAESESEWSSVALRVLPWLLLAAFALLTWLTRAPGVRTRQDDARYILLAQSIQSGSYRDVLWPGAPLHHMYPPGYPALLAAWMAIGGARFDSLVALQILLSVAALALMYSASRTALSRSVALWSLAILAFNPWFIDWSGRVASEGALAVCVSLAVWATVALPRGRIQVATLIAAAALAPLMRAAGLAITAAVFALWLSQRRYRDIVLLSAIVAPIVVAMLWWTLRDPSHVPGNSYVGDLALAGAAQTNRLYTLVQRVSTNVNYYATRALPVLLAAPTIEGTLIDNVVTMALTFVALMVGGYRAWYQFRGALLALLFTAGLLMAWPYYDARFAIPVLPVIVPVMLDGMTELGTMVYERRGALLMPVVAIVLTLSGLTTVSGTMYAERACVRGLDMPPANCVSRDQASFFRAVTFVRDSLPATERVLSAKSEPLYFYTHHPTLPLAEWAPVDSQTFWRGLRDLQTRYILLGALHAAEKSVLAPRLRARCNSLRLVAAFPPYTYLFEVPVPGDTTLAGAGSAAGTPNVACLELDNYLHFAPSP